VKLGVEFLKRDFSTPLTFPDVVLKPERYSWHRWGGPELATLQAYGSPVALWQMVNWLRAPVTIRDERGKAVWWGYIAEVTVGVGPVQMGLTLQGMANRVKVFYPDQADGSPAQDLETDWAEDADSISTYGTFELVARLTDTSATLEMANAWRDQLLELYKYPVPVMRFGGQGGSELKATVKCRGWWFSLAWEHYANMATEDAETTSQIATIAGQGQHISGTDVPDQSGVYTSQFRDGTERMLEIVELMLASGVDGGNQLASTVTADRLVRVFEEPSADELYLLPDGRVADVYGNPLLNHECPVAKWCALREVIPPVVIVSRLADVGRFFVERSEYTVADGRWMPFPKGQPSAGSALVSAAAGKGGGAGFVGRFEGPHAGLFRFENDDGTWSVLMQASDTANVPFLSAGARNFKSNSRWLKLGYEDRGHAYLRAPTDGSTDPEEHTDLVVIPTRPVTTVAANYTALFTDAVIETTAAVAVTLPDAAEVKGRVYEVKHTGGGVTTVVCTGGVDGVGGVSLAQQDGVRVISNGTTWMRIPRLQIESGGPEFGARKLESGDYRVLESGDYRLLE